MNRKKTLWSKVFWMLVLLILLGTLVVSADESTEVILHNCDTADGWNFAGAEIIEIERQDIMEGDGALEWSTKSAFWVTRLWETPIDASGANTLVFDLYISSITDFYNSGTVEFTLEITSAGIYDKEEAAFTLDSLELSDGWNHIELELVSSSCDYSRVNYMRMFTVGTNAAQPLTYRLDNMYFAHIEKEEVDLGDQVVGERDDATAQPPEKDITVNRPYDPWTTTKADEPSAPSTAAKEDHTTAIVLFIVSAVLLIGAGIVCFTLKKYRLTIAAIAAGVALILAVVGLCMLLFADVPGSNDGTTPPVTLHPFFTVDQTGHPEVSGADVDVEALLKVDPSYSTKKDYEIRFVSSLPQIDLSQLPHVTLHENASNDQGLTISFADGRTARYLNYVGVDTWLMDLWAKTNVFSVTTDAATRSEWNGKDLSLNFRAHFNTPLTVTISYVDIDGQTKTVETKTTRAKEWMVVSVCLEKVSLCGALEGGADFQISFTGPDITRLNALYLSAPIVQESEQLGLIQSQFESSFYSFADANVKSFGATGNGVTDDTKAFLEAIAYVKELGGGTVFVPAGYYCLTSTLSLPIGVGLVGELETGTANGTVLCIYGGKGSIDPNEAAILMDHQSAVMNVAFWYPEQTFVNGMPIPYPPTMTQIGSESVTIRNVTLINSYFGIHFGACDNNSLQYVRDIYGTCLDVGYYNNNSYDIGRFENVSFTPDIWLASGLPGTPNATLLRTYMLRNSTGMWMQRIDWTYYADITIEGYHIGMLYNASETGAANGHAYHIQLLDCYYGIYAEAMSWMMLTDSTIRTTGGEGATAVYICPSSQGNLSFSHCVFSSDGANAMVNEGAAMVSMTLCTLSSKGESTYVDASGAKETLINTDISGNADRYPSLKLELLPSLKTDVGYDKAVITKPASTAVIHMGETYGIKKNDDITEALKDAIAKLGEGGGTIYIPAGTYTISEPITVTKGIELRGAASWVQNAMWEPTRNQNTGTVIHTQVGRKDPDGEALFTLYDGAGLRGLSVWYTAQNTAALEPYSYTVRGRGKGIYVVDVALPTSWRGIDFSTYRCDEHYVEYLWGSFMNIGISVGSGSENGIIRDCQFTPNSWPLRDDTDWWDQVYEPIMEQGRPWIIGESKNQILYHNFTYGARQGLSVHDGAKDVYVLGHGVDSGYTSAYFAGDCSVHMVNAQLVNLYQKKAGLTMNYLVTDESFTGTLDLINSAYWGATTGAMDLRGEGNVRLLGVLMQNAGAPMCTISGGTLEIYGMLNVSRTKDFNVLGDTRALILSGNIYSSGLQIDRESDCEAEIRGTDLEE